MRTSNRLIGSPIARVEDLRFLRGRGEYVDDIAGEGVLHAAILRSSVAHGRIRAIDASRARALKGVHAVITAKDLGDQVPHVPMRLQPLPDFEPFAQPVLAHSKVRYVGEALAVVSRWMKRKHVLEREPRVTEVSVGPALLILASLCVAMPPARSELAISARARTLSTAVSGNG